MKMKLGIRRKLSIRALDKSKKRAGTLLGVTSPEVVKPTVFPLSDDLVIDQEVF